MCHAPPPPLHLDLKLYRVEQLEIFLPVQLLPLLVRSLPLLFIVHLFHNFEQRKRLWCGAPLQFDFLVELDILFQRRGISSGPVARVVYDAVFVDGALYECVDTT